MMKIGNKIIALGIVLVVLLGAMIGMASALSNLGGGDWAYYKDITVKENSGKSLTGFQVLVELNPSNFPANAKSDGSDLRFEDSNGKELNYWIEDWDFEAKEAKIWVKVPSIPVNGETKIKMYYGNPSAGAVSDGDKVFEFFDDFEGKSLDIDKWIIFGNPRMTFSNSILNISGSCGAENANGDVLESKKNFNYPLIYEAYYKYDHTPWGNYAGIGLGRYSYPVSTHCAIDVDNSCHDNKGAFVIENGNSRDVCEDWVVNDWEKTKIVWTDKFVSFERGSAICTFTSIIPSQSMPVHLGDSYFNSNNFFQLYVDWIFAHKYTSPKPTLSLSTEILTTAPTPAPPTQTVWQIGEFDTSGSEFGGYDFPSMVDYIIPADWATRTAWKDFPSGQQAWKTDDSHPYNSNGVNIHFEALAGEYVLTIGQQKTSHSETVPVLLDGRHIESFVTSTTVNKNHVIKFKMDSSGSHSLTLDRFTSGYGYRFDAVKLEVVEYAPTPTIPPTPAPPTPPSGKIKAVWLYNPDKYDTSTLMPDLKSAGINTIFLSTDVNDIWKYERFVKSAHENGIEVHAMILEDSRCALEKNHASSIKAVETVLDYNEKSLAKFDGINIDTEPYVDLDLEQVWQDYITLLEAIHEKTEGRTVLSADVPRWYDEGKIKDIAPNVDFFTIMAYDSGGAGWNTTSEIEDAVASEMGAIRGESSKAVIGIGVHEGFEDKGAVEKCVDNLYRYYSGDSAFSGVSIFKYESYSGLSGVPEVPTGEEKGIPGFEAVFATVGLLAVAYILRKKK